ncbi:hypothetical protein LDO32_03100 [Luteimonas sp. Y-2-2-4F]|nr:hypothetical protein [Luteimonas sp. Y-2-2-4F]MCD9030720.1 hypothetical protein [Luteimonas sp. Y-2-2-4F]
MERVLVEVMARDRMWEVRFRGELIAREADPVRAFDRADSLARLHHRIHRVPTGVRMLDERGAPFIHSDWD